MISIVRSDPHVLGLAQNLALKLHKSLGHIFIASELESPIYSY